MTNRKFFVWSGWGFVIVLFYVVVILPGLGILDFSRLNPGYISIIEHGDFPDSYSVTWEKFPWQIYPGIPENGNANYYRIIVNRDGPAENQQWGHVVVVQYSSDEVADKAYEAIRREAEFNHTARPLPFGERGSQSTPTYAFNSSDVIFQQCGAVVHVTLEDNMLDFLVGYARRLYERMTPIICKE